MLDTNILVSALLTPSGTSADICRAWIEGRFTLFTCPRQIEEFRRTLRKPYIESRLNRQAAGRMTNALHDAEETGPLPQVRRSPDPDDDFLLAMVEAGSADYLVTGDKSGLLTLVKHARARIVTAREFADLLG